MKKQVFLKFFMILITLLSYFSPILSVNALVYQGTINGNSVTVRKGPGTNYASVASYSSGKVVNMPDNKLYTDESTGSSKCPVGWYKIYYTSTSIGYVCGSYLIVEGIELPPVPDKYDRPWLSPKESIIGGAKFISESYIGRGQFTPYLQKFNVNPANTNTYAHQYMANIRAPYTESNITYKSYNSSKLINQPLVFSLPVFKNMPTETTLSGYTRSNNGTEEVSDEGFEALLEKEKFPDTYKDKLRKLHIDHPNWVFEAMHTNLDFDAAVKAEKLVCSIDSTNTAYVELINGSPKQTEKGWYLVNYNVTAYFMDPRNFLDEIRVLQFEKLSYSDVFKESDVQFVLNDTFMSGFSLLDNQLYSSIFMEAGLIANVNPVYLASKSRLEVGTSVGRATSGETFTYNDITYTGLYNFFNIGASSSATNPVLAGLVYAAGGSLLPIVPNSIGNYITNRGYKISGSNISKIEVSTKAETLISKFKDYEVTIIDNDGKSVAGNTVLGTGFKVTLSDGEDRATYTLIIYGDIDGDGEIDSTDLLRLRQHILKQRILSGPFKDAADVDKDGEIDPLDLLKIKQHILKQTTISQ